MPSLRRAFLVGLSLFCFLTRLVRCAQVSTILHAKRQYENHVNSTIDPNAANHTDSFFSFITRPDIQAPRWNITNYHPETTLAPGYWFTSGYENMVQRQDENVPWVGPTIYDGEGQLVWSGAQMFKGWNVNNFKVSRINGADMLTCIFKHRNQVVVLNNSYEIMKAIDTSDEAKKIHTDGHEFMINADGTRAIAIFREFDYLTDEETRVLGFDPDVDGQCRVAHTGFKVFDTLTWEQVFQWSSKGHIGLREGFRNPKCLAWDYLHGNSVDQFADGDYLFSGRHTDTMYKISGDDGTIVWRLGGRNSIPSDFELLDGLHFSGQHHARIHEQNSTHIVMTLLDNAIRDGEPHITNDQSRGMVLSLQIDIHPMTARMIHTYNHPHGELLHGRGNLELLDNGNVFLGWSMYSLFSEHSLDGTLLMEASWKPELRTYRTFKFSWVGRPASPPDVYATAFTGDGGWTQTAVFVSWNGDTEVDNWNLYETTADNNYETLLMSEPRRGFETLLLYEGVVDQVIVEGVDRDGQPLGRSLAMKTLPAVSELSPPILKDEAWMRHLLEPKKKTSWLTNYSGLIFFICGFFTCATVVVFVMAFTTVKSEGKRFQWLYRRPWQANHHYEAVDGGDELVHEREAALVPIVADEEK